MHLSTCVEQPFEASESPLCRQLGEENQNSKDGEMAVSPIPLSVSVSPGLTPTRPRTDMHCGARVPRRRPLVMLQGPRWGPWHSGCVWWSPQHCSISPPSSQAPDLDSVSSGGRSGRDGRGTCGNPRTEDCLPNLRLSRPRGGR